MGHDDGESLEGEGLFVEQAEYIDDKDFADWTIEHPHQRAITSKLSQGGAKLITGPRGCGKTTLLLRIYRRLVASRTSFPVYVNFKSSLKLEPLYKDKANATYLFGQWMLCKVYVGIHDSLDALSMAHLSSGLALEANLARSKASRLELGDIDESGLEGLSPAVLEADMVAIVQEVGARRCVLLLDDAAHAFSPDQQRDFFDLFRQLKSKTISPKAAIYPGVTIFSPTFHVGHDAEEIDVWVQPDSQDYLPFVKKLLAARLPQDVVGQLDAKQDLVDLMSFAAFGMPRALLNMIRSLYRDVDGDEGVSQGVRLDRKHVLSAINANLESTLSVFSSLSQKLPMYERFIQVGNEVFTKTVLMIKEYNRGKPIGRQSTTIAIKRPLPAELAKVLSFFQYAGLLFPKGDLSRGSKGVFELYEVHYAALIARNAIVGAKAVSVGTYVEVLRKRSAHEFTRTTAKVLLGADDAASVLSLSLPPCQSCQTPRVTDAAKFCLNCGAKLKGLSVFESLVAQPIECLPLTGTRVKRIKERSTIRTVKDILIDHENRALRGVPRIGPYWAKQIYAYAEEFIA